MVFESIITDLMNKYLGDFVENLDKSQLKLSIWGGDIVLQNLDLKESALDDLDLPIKVKSGHLGKLTLKIPWKSLYSSPVVANIDGLYVLAVPNIDIKYDAEKDAKQKEEKKQKELEKVEQAKELARQKEKGKSKEQKADSFAEKMAFQIVKNLQVQISNIHVRYEDKYTNPESPFAVGATLHDLSFQTCDANWKKCLIDSASNMIFKLIELDCLALYWNTNSRLYSDLPRSQLQNVLKGGIAAREKNIPPYDYMIKPISMKSQLRINPKPASDLETPKVYFNLILEEIAVSFSKKQFRDTMEMLESFERMSRNEPYRKYRPSVPLKGHAKEWWHYAQSSILEETVKRRSSMWSWSSMSKHRELGKQYKEVWKEKLKTKKPTKKLLDTINSYEQHLNVFNIVLARQQAETEVAKSGSKVTKSKSEEKGKSKGWFGGYFGGKKKKETEETEENKYKSQFAEAMSPAEKAKLFQAIGYSESGAEDPTFPVDYIGMKLHFTLKKTSLQLRDTDLKQPDIVKVVVDDLYASLQQRPSGNAIRLESKIDSFSVFGAQHENGEIPQMVKSQKGDGGSVLSLLNLQVETNPLDGKADQRITVTSRPLEIIYDAVTINHVADFFKTPEDVHLSELQAAAMSTLDTIRNQSATGMNYMIQSRKVTDISVDIKGSYAIIPENGIYDSSASLIIANLGDFKMQSLQADKLAEWRRQQCVPIEDLLNKAYDKFSLKLQSVQVILAKPGEDWKAAILEPKSALHVLQPTELSVELHKCMLTNDTRVPQVRIVGELPQLNVQISDQKIHELIKIADSIPLPKSDSPSPSASQKMAATVPEQLTAGYEVHAPTNLKIAGHQDVDVVLESDSDTESSVSDDFFTPAQSEEDMIQKFGKEGPLEQLTQLELNFEIKEVALNVSRFKDNKEIPLIGIAVQNLGTEVTIRTFDINVAAFVGSITVEHKHFTAPGGAGPLYLVSTPTSFKQEDNLLSVHYKKADKKSPEFYTTYEKTEQSIRVSFTALEVVAHLSAILGLLDFVDTVVPKSDEVSKEPDVVDDEGYISDNEKKQKRQRYTRPEPRSEIDVKVMADLDTVSLVICSDTGIVATAKVNGLKAGVMVQRHQTRIEASLKDIAIHDPMPNAAYPKILSIKDAEVFHLNIVAHNSATVGEWYSDMSSVDTEIELNLGRIGIVFLNKFVMEILDFIDHFQAAKDAVKDASASAASTAAAKVQNLHERSARVVLDITIQAPLIIIPQNSLSLNAIIADLGVLTVSNSFSIAGENTDKYIPPIVDTMMVKLSSVKLGRVRMEENRIKSEVSILEPVDIIIEIKRNLAASWYHQIPDIDIGGKIPAMKVALGQDDFTMVMATLDENLQEGQKEKPKKAPTEPTVKPTDEKKRRGSTKGTTIIEITPKSKAVWTKLIFNFYIESISAALFTGKTDLMSSIGIVDRNPDSGLSKVDMCMVGVDGTMWTDDSMHAHVELGNIVLDDIRPGRNTGIYRMFDRYQTAKERSNETNMIDVLFKQSPSQDKEITVKVKKMFVCLCLEYLLTVADFFTKGLPKKEAEEESPLQSKAVQKVEKSPATAEKSEAPVGTIRIKLTVENPEIVLVADATDLETAALVLQTEIELGMTISPSRLTMSGAVHNLQIIHCPFLRSKRPMDSSKVLQPCTISLHLSQPTNEGQHIDIAVTEIALSASPRIIQTMSAIAASMKPPPEPDEEEKRKAKESIPVDLWTVKHLQDCNFWFLKEAKPIDDDFVLDPCDLLEEETPVETRGDQLLMKIEKICLTLEAGIGTQTLPMIMLEANVTTEVKDWTSKLYVSSDISMDVSYYNIGMAEWEPLLEPVEVVGGHRPWELNIEVKKNEEENGGSEDDDSTIDLAFALPVMTVSISSNDILELTMTKSCISLLTNLGKAFGEAVDQPSSKSSRKVGDVIPPFIVKNCLGKDITVEPGSVFEESKESNGRIVMKPGQKLPLNPSTAVKSLLSKRSFLKKDLSDMRREISVQVKDFKEIFNIPIHRAGRRLYNLQQTEGYPHILYSIVIDVEADMGSKIVNIRSPLRVHNHMPFAMDLYSTGSSNEMMHFGSVGANELGTVPLVPSHGQNIFAKPHDMHYRLCDSGISWKKSWDLKETGKPNLVYRCSFEKPGHAPYYFTVSIEKDEYTYIKGSLDKTPTYTLHVLPTVRVKNLLPVKMKCVVQDAADEISLGEGEVKPLFNADLGKVLELRIPDYLEKEWTAKMTLRNGMKELSGLKFTAYQGTQEVTVELGIFVDYNKGFKDMAVYAPYWMVNKTGLPLSYRGTDDKNITFHPESMEEPVLFAFHKQLLGKKMASLKVLDSDWSNKFSLDTVGSSGAITCKTKEMNYEIGVKIHLTHAALTKVVTFTPMYLVVNHAEFAMSVSEEETDEWREIPPGECVPLWPVSKNKKEPKLRLKKLESDVVSDPFVFTKPGSVLLQVDDPKVGGVGVLINVSDWSNIISLNAYHRGAATVQIINHCTDTMVQYKQSGHVTTKAIGPKEAVLYTWQDPCGKKELSWAIDKTTKRDALITDGIGEVDTVDGRCYWISFLDGMQRTLMFTEDLLIATVAQQAGELEQADMEILLSLQGIGMSLVNNQTGSEILYMGITSSGIMWEFQKRRRWKSLTNKQNQILETAFQNLQTQLAVGKVVAQGPQTLEGNLEVDFFAMKMLKPNKRKIRRTYAPGIWASYKASEHQLQLHAKINRLQIDNQLPASVFPTVLAPVPPPKSVSAESEPKPFIELSNMTRYGQHTQIKQVKYFKLLIQEMHAKVDQGFLNALMLMFESEEPTPEQELEYFEVDVEKTASKLKDSQEVQTVMGEDRNFYDNLHLSPIKIHLSFSLHDSGDDPGASGIKRNATNAPVHLLLQSVGVTLTNIQDVVFKLGFFERQHQFYTTNELTGEGIKHYSSQAIKQAYVLVLGLDVLGNPFGFVRGLTEGVTDLFYEPYQGAVQGPEEFAEGLALGVRSLFGHAVGGAAGVVSRVTGTLGKGLAALTMDEEYQKKRLKAMNQRPADLKEGLARGGKGLVMGFVEGVSGIVVQPVKGAKKEGAAGFFKGVGKGLVGVVAKPTGGVIDMASSAFDGIRRVAEFSEEIRPLRPPRLIHDDGIVRPYVKKEAQGYGIFIETEKGKFVITDKYYAHAVVTKDGRCVLLVTNRRLLFVSKGDLLGHWNCEWQHTYAMLKEPPVLTEKGITILLKDDGQKKKRGFGSFFGGAASTGKIVTISDSKTAQWLIGKIHEAMAKSGV